MKNYREGFLLDLKKILELNELNEKDLMAVLTELQLAKDDDEKLKKVIAKAKKIDVENMDIGTKLWLEGTIRYLKETHRDQLLKSPIMITEKDRAETLGLSVKEFQEISSLPNKGFYKEIMKGLPKPVLAGRIRSLLGPFGKFFVRCKNCEYDPISLGGDCPVPGPLRGGPISVRILTILRFYCRYYKGEFPLWRTFKR